MRKRRRNQRHPFGRFLPAAQYPLLTIDGEHRLIAKQSVHFNRRQIAGDCVPCHQQRGEQQSPKKIPR